MPRLIVTRGAVASLQRCGQFLARRDPGAARRAADAIDKALAGLETIPEAGRCFALNDGFRELLIGFGKPGHVALYRYEVEVEDDTVYVLAFRPRREAGY